MLVQVGEPSGRRAVRLIFSGEKVRPEYSETAPEIGPCRTIRQIRVIPLADLVRMKLTSFRAKDEAHINDLDEAGLITPDIEAGLSERYAPFGSERARERVTPASEPYTRYRS